jgi:hypothetical protein
MPRGSTRVNLYHPMTKGYSIYKVKDKHEKYLCQRRFESGFQKSWTFHSVNECLEKLRDCPDEEACRAEYGDVVL